MEADEAAGTKGPSELQVREAVSLDDTSSSDFGRVMIDSIRQHPDVVGAGDILCIGGGTSASRAADICTAMIGLREESGAPAMTSFLIIVPPGGSVEEIANEVREGVRVGFARFARREMTETEDVWFGRALRIVPARNLQVSSMTDMLRETPARTVVIVTEAATYRDERVASFVPAGQNAPQLPEDNWVPHLHALALACMECARCGSFYVGLDADQLSPRRPELQALLQDVEGCGVLGSEQAHDPVTAVANHVDDWKRDLDAGRLGPVLASIENLTDVPPADKPLLRIRAMHAAGAGAQALEAIQTEVKPGDDRLSAEARTKLAQIAVANGAPQLAADLLGPAIDELAQLEALELALAVSDELADWPMEGRIAARLRERFPASTALAEHNVRILSRARDYLGVADILEADPARRSRAPFYRQLANAFAAVVPDYTALIDSAGDDLTLRDAYRSASVLDARRRLLLIHAFDLSLPLPASDPHRGTVSVALAETIEDIFLAGSGDRPGLIDNARITAAVSALTQALAENPNAKRLRIALGRVLDHEVAGRTGTAVLVANLLRLMAKPTYISTDAEALHMSADELLEQGAFVESVFEWLSHQAPVVLGRAKLPRELLTLDADAVVEAVAVLLDRFGDHAAPEDEPEMLKWLMFACVIAPHSQNPDEDLPLMRLVAGKLATLGRRQIARDLTEQMLDLASTPRRRRLAWFAMADVYHRCGQHVEALIAMNCCLSADDQVTEEQLWYEIVGVIRLLRDTGLHDQALQLVVSAHALLERMGMLGRYDHRLEIFRLQIEQTRLFAAQFTLRQLSALIDRVVANARIVLERHDSPGPIAVMLGQLLMLGSSRGLQVADDWTRTMSALHERLGKGMGGLVRAFSSNEIAPDDLFSLVANAGTTRYSQDVGFDMAGIALAASRALGSANFLQDPVASAFALEQMSDRGVALPGWQDVASPPAQWQMISGPAEALRELSSRGMDLLLLAFDAGGRVISQTAIGGTVHPAIRENLESISEERFKAWAERYPYDYGVDEKTLNLFHVTTDNLILSSMPEGPTVIIADSEIQSYPPNLLRIGDRFAGELRPMAAAPSIGWLTGAVPQGLIGDGRMCAWISKADSEGESRTLEMILTRLGGTFDQYGFTVDNSPALPRAFSGASLVVVAAHGSIHPEGHIFQLISDEGVLRASAADLAGALRNVGVVVLFVCSGGRLDKRPGASTTLGLAKQILDRGAAAVVASPWPLDARVPSHWLPRFLDVWNGDTNLATANFAANEMVGKAFAQDPARGLAMSVFGNPFLLRA